MFKRPDWTEPANTRKVKLPKLLPYIVIVWVLNQEPNLNWGSSSELYLNRTESSVLGSEKTLPELNFGSPMCNDIVLQVDGIQWVVSFNSVHMKLVAIKAPAVSTVVVGE